MNFFEHQERARRKTGLLVVLFVLAVAAIVGGVNVAVALSMGLLDYGWDDALGRHRDMMAVISLATLALIGGATVFRIASLGSGGGSVAQAMGGTPVTPDTSDPQLRRFRNVVEEIALASGVPTPQIFVMENESAINAFAAGYAPTDAVVAVTRGTLDHLSRDELQGVVAHEFSHIVNGDIRLNIRLMGVLFGILVIGIIGRSLLYGGRGSRRSSGNRGGIAILGIALFLLGYIGIFFGRLIKAAVSRQREYLADAAAVQFTRQPSGIAGALKKIAALSEGARLRAADTEEVSHMLFANGLPSFFALWATHPPLHERIRAIEPGFQPGDIDLLRKNLQRQNGAATVAPAGDRKNGLERAQVLPGMPRIPGAGGAIPQAAVMGAVLADLEQPDPVRLAHASALREAIPKILYDAAHDPDAVVPLVLVLLLEEDAALRTRQLDLLSRRIEAEAMALVRELAPATGSLEPAHRLPLIDLAVPALRRQPPESLRALLPLVLELIKMDDRVSVFEYALGRLLSLHVRDILKPRQARTGGRVRLKDTGKAVADLFAVFALHGHDDTQARRAAYEAGMTTLYSAMHTPEYRAPENWIKSLDGALAALDALAVKAKQEVIKGLVSTIAHDGVITIQETELLRAACGCLHVPMPPILPAMRS